MRDRGCRPGRARGTFEAPPLGLGGALSREACVRTSLRARLAAVAAALLVAGLMAGCNDERPPEPKATASGSGSSPPTATPESTPAGPVEPTLPAEARKGDKAGVEAFVRFYWEVINYATKTGDVGLLKKLDQPSCDGCARGIRGVERVYGRGGRIEGGSYRVTRLQPSRSPSGHWSVITHTKIGDQRTTGAGSLDGRFPGGRATWLLGVARIRTVWTITSLEGL